MYTKAKIKEMVDKGYTLITPQEATIMLERNRSNRAIRPRFVSELVSKINAGQWCPDTPDHIAFYEDGTLANGQHRLKAIQLSGTPVFTKIDWHVPKSAAICIDTGNSRSFGDNIKILTGETFYTKKVSKMVRESFVNGHRFTHEDHLKVATTLKEEIMFVVDLFRGAPRYVSQSSVMVAVFTALMNGVSRSVLADFCEALVKGRAVTEGGEVALKLRDRLQIDFLSGASTDRLYFQQVKRAQNAIWYFVNNMSVKQLHSTDIYRYPLISRDILQDRG